jgi:hypothetical protein
MDRQSEKRYKPSRNVDTNKVKLWRTRLDGKRLENIISCTANGAADISPAFQEFFIDLSIAGVVDFSQNMDSSVQLSNIHKRLHVLIVELTENLEFMWAQQIQLTR